MKEYFEQIHEGFPISDLELIDTHAHLGPYFNMFIPACDSDSMVKNMDRCGIDKTIVSANIGLVSDFTSGNTMMLQSVQSHRGRLYGACLVNGHYPEKSIDELERCFSVEKHVVMIKIHPVLNKCSLTDKRLIPVFHFASDRGLIILVHTWLDNDAYGNQEIFAGVAKEYPDVKWIMGHSGGPYGGRRAVEIAEELPNVFLDITTSTCPARQIEFLVKEAGSERVLFGTDNPFIDPRPQIGRVALANISHNEMANIFGKNIKRYINFD